MGIAWTITGRKREFLIRQTSTSLIVGGIQKNRPDDQIEKEATIANSLTINIKKGTGHTWTRYCEDCVLVYKDKLVAVFDGVSGPMDGSGGIAARTAAELLRKKARRINEKNYIAVLDEWNKECAPLHSTTLLILLQFANKRVLLNKGDSVGFLDGKQINERHGHGNVVYKVLGDSSPFDEYDVPQGEVKLCTDGIYEAGDDVTIVNIL